MSIVMNYYLNRYAFRSKMIQEEVDPQTGIIVVIPCHNEPDLVSALQSLDNCENPNCKVEVCFRKSSPNCFRSKHSFLQ